MLRNRKADAVVLIIVVAVALVGGWLALSSDSPGLTGFFSFQPQISCQLACIDLGTCLFSPSPSASPSASPSTPPSTSSSSSSSTTSSTLPPTPPPPSPTPSNGPGGGGSNPGPPPPPPPPPPPTVCGKECPYPNGCTPVDTSCSTDADCPKPYVCIRYGVDAQGMVCMCGFESESITPPPPPTTPPPPAGPLGVLPPPPEPPEMTTAEPEYQGPPVVYQPTGAFDRYTNGSGGLIAGIILILALMAGISVLVMRKRPGGKVDVLGDFSKKSVTKPHKSHKHKRKK